MRPGYVAPAYHAGRPSAAFAEGIDQAERVADLRSLCSIVHLTTGSRGDALAQVLRLAENDMTRLPAAIEAMANLAHIDRRHILASFARLHRCP